jgi:hypothetical protein
MNSLRRGFSKQAQGFPTASLNTVTVDFSAISKYLLLSVVH